MREKLTWISRKFFKYRSYTPLPFLILMVVFAAPTVTSLLTGFILALIGESIRFWGVSWAGSETRTTSNVSGSYLIISGPFAYMRNPLYVGNMLMYLGIGIMSLSLFPYLQISAVVFFALQYFLIVREEEKYLSKQFANEYADYCKNVPRFFPRLSKYKNSSNRQPERSNTVGFKSERRTLQAFVGVSMVLVIIWVIQNL